MVQLTPWFPQHSQVLPQLPSLLGFVPLLPAAPCLDWEAVPRSWALITLQAPGISFTVKTPFILGWGLFWGRIRSLSKTHPRSEMNPCGTPPPARSQQIPN